MSDEDVVRAMLSVAGLELPPDELSELVAGFPALRAGLELLYGPEFSGADPYLAPTIGTDWSLS
jgi:hypothetical protein